MKALRIATSQCPPCESFHITEALSKSLLLGAKPLILKISSLADIELTLPDFRTRMAGVLLSEAPHSSYVHLSPTLCHASMPAAEIPRNLIALEALAEALFQVRSREDQSQLASERSRRLETELKSSRLENESSAKRLRELAHEQIEETKTLLEISQQLAKVGGWIMDLENGASSFSSYFYEIYEIDATQPINPYRLAEMVQDPHKSDVNKFFEALVSDMSTEIKSIEVPILTGKNNRKIVRINARILRGTQNKIVGTTQDITAKAALEFELHQAKKMEAIGRLAGGVAHDFNNKIGAVMMTCHSAKDCVEEGSEIHEYLKLIEAGAQSAIDLVSQLLAFGRKQVLKPKLLDLNTCVSNSVNMLSRLMGSPIQVRMELGREMGKILFDPAQLDQVIMNLVLNARDAMPNGGALYVRTRILPQDSRPGRYACLEIEDTGLGMSEEVLSHIFEPFFTTKDSQKGTGLGLATVEGIVRQSGGKILVSSRPNKGSTFEVLIPIADCDEALGTKN